MWRYAKQAHVWNIRQRSCTKPKKHSCVDKSSKILKLSGCKHALCSPQITRGQAQLPFFRLNYEKTVMTSRPTSTLAHEYHTPQGVRTRKVLTILPASLREPHNMSRWTAVPIRKKTNHLVTIERNGKPFSEMNHVPDHCQTCC